MPRAASAREKKRDIERYYFKLYALDTMLDLPPSTTKADLLAGH